MSKNVKKNVGVVFLMFCLCFSLVSCGATRESYYDDLVEYNNGFLDIQDDLVSTSTSFSKDPLDADKAKALQTSMKAVATYLRKGDSLKAPSDLADMQSSFGEACIAAADAVDSVVTLLDGGLENADVSDFNDKFTSFDSKFSKFGTELSKVMKESGA